MYDLRSFLDIISRDRTPAPAEAVERLQGICDTVMKTLGVKWMTPERVLAFEREARQQCVAITASMLASGW